MRKLTLTLVAGSALALAACGGNKAANNSAANGMDNMSTGNAAASTMTPTTGGNASGNASASASAWPEGARIVEENGVTYRVDAGGARTRLTSSDSRIVVENGVRYRVDPDGARVRISPEGLRIGDSVIRGNAPNGRSDVETPGETVTDAAEDAVEAIGDIDGK